MIPAGQSKPQYGSIVKPSQRVFKRDHPLAPYCKAAFLFNEVGAVTVWDAVTGTFTLASTTGGTVNNIGAVCDAATRGFKATLPASLKLNWPMTVVVRATVLGSPTAGGEGWFGLIHNDTVASPFLSMCLDYSGGAGQPWALGYNSGGSFSELASSTSLIIGETAVIAGRITASTQDIFKNGQNIASTTNSLSNPTYNSDAQFIVGDCRAGLTQNANTTVHVGYLFNIALPNSAIQELAVNPFALFEYAEPQRRTLFPVAAIPTVWHAPFPKVTYPVPTLQSYSDSFTQSNENPLSSGGMFLTYSGQSNLKVVGNRVRYAGPLTGSPPDGVQTVNNSVPGADQRAQITLTTWTPGATSDSKAGIILRASAPNTSTWYFLGSQKSAGNKSAIIKYIAGTPTTLASNNIDWTSGDVVAASVIADVLCLYKNGTQVLTVKDTAITAAGRIGLLGWLNGGVEGDLEFTAFSGGDFPSNYTLHQSVDITNPNFAVDSPANGASIHGAFNVGGWTYDNAGLTSIEILVDGISAGFATYGNSTRYDVATVWLGAPTAINYNLGLNTGSYAGGAHVITVKFRDIEGHIALSTDINVTFT